MEIYHIPDHLVDMDKEGPVSWLDYSNPTGNTQLKIALNTHLFSFVLQGEKQIATLDQHNSIQSREFLMLRKSHCLMTERLDGSMPYRSMLLAFDEQLIHEFVFKHNIKLSPPPHEDSYMVFENDAFTRNYIRSLQLLPASQSSAALKKAKFEELMLYLTQKYGEQILHFFMTPHRESFAFQQKMEAHVQHKLSLEELAFLCHMSLSTFKRKFQQEFGSSPSKWFLKKRLEQAAYMLRIKQQSPSEVYLETGFESLSSFVQSFKKHFGITPQQYQQHSELSE
jgi:AraC-like DNA-binding protein